MKPTEALMHEHQIILLVLKAVEREANAIATSGSFDAHKLSEIVDFFRNFTDKCHHGKEEKHLFEKMVERGMPKDEGPIAVMLMEHEQGREYVRSIAGHIEKAGAGDAGALNALSSAMRDYATLLKEHIYKEDNILYPMADELFTEADQQELSEAFDRVEKEEMGEGIHEKYHELAHRLAEGL